MPKRPTPQYRLALANSYARKSPLELRDKKKSESFAEAAWSRREGSGQ